MPSLEYTIQRTENEDEIFLKAQPNEWATTANVTVVLKDHFNPKNRPVPRIAQIGWSAGAREWTVEDARTFFRAALEMLDKAEEELKQALVTTKL